MKNSGLKIQQNIREKFCPVKTGLASTKPTPAVTTLFARMAAAEVTLADWKCLCFQPKEVTAAVMGTGCFTNRTGVPETHNTHWKGVEPNILMGILPFHVDGNRRCQPFPNATLEMLLRCPNALLQQ